jgi:ribosomal protein S21
MSKEAMQTRNETELGPLEVKVDGAVERAIGRLKRAMAREGILKAKRKQRDAERRRRRSLRTRPE